MKPIAKSEYKTMLVLIILGGLGYSLGLPYRLEAAGETNVPLLDILLSILIDTAITGIVVVFGYLFARPVGLGAPIIKAKIEGESASERVKSILKIAPLLGVLSGLAVLVLDIFVFVPLLTGTVTPTATYPSLGSRVLAIFYGGFFEEILVRLLIMSFFVWFFWKLTRSDNATSHPWIYWLGLMLAAVLLGALHLSLSFAIYGVSALVVIRALALNLIPGLVFGWLYWKKGIEAAMVSHMCADFIIHVVLVQIIIAFL
jgi:hypothetical protein